MMKIITVLLALMCLSISAISQSDKFYEKEGMVYSDNKPYTGEFIVEKDGMKEILYNYKSGVKDGEVIHYYTSGDVKEVGFYSQGKKDGKWEKWDEEGNKIAEAHYSNGAKTGSWLVWDKQGTKRYEMFYQNDEKTGKWRIWDDKGVLTQEREF